MIKGFRVYQQLDSMDCGPTCLRMIAKFYGRNYSLSSLRDFCFLSRDGVSLNGISEGAEKIGFRTHSAKLTFQQLDEEAILPCILHWNQNHFVVLPPQNYKRNKKRSKIIIADPAHGLVKIDQDTFLKSWINPGTNLGYALLLEPSPFFHENTNSAKNKIKFSFLFGYLKPYKKYISQLFVGMIIGSLLSLIAPFLTQSLVDYGINQQNIGFVYLILFAQIALFFGNTAIEIIRSWLILHVNTRINISIISDFLIKLMRLPIKFFDIKRIGDITQRITDHQRIEQFLTGTSLYTLFSLINLLVFSFVLAIYSIQILIVFLVGSAISLIWILIFLKKRRELDYIRFQRMSENQNNLYEIITGMQDIKMNGSETSHRWGWERIQAKLFKLNVKSLSLSQIQSIGSTFFTQLKNIFISFIAAKEVINGNISLGMMLSVSYITGQMNSPIEQLLSFFQIAQDAKISIERLNEIHNSDDEEKGDELNAVNEIETLSANPKENIINHNIITLDNVSFQYADKGSPLILNKISLNIPIGKTTAIVGSSGSGKTTLMKLLLKFYEPTSGTISLGQIPLGIISPKWWREQLGVVMTDGYIFSNTIAQNISVHEESEQERLRSAIKAADLEDFINSLPLGVSTRVGNSGNGISSGQKQRILIARAIYKVPKFLFLDEATNTLDAKTENTIVENLNSFFFGRTVIVIAHRLSTVKKADQIVVMEKGEIIEIGKHESLIRKKGRYYDLVKNQLELGN
ncbi:MAG: peptidase domain-containing ABC transporter [Agriterribacter sp.]